MPMIDADGCLLNVSVEGRDGGPTIMLSNSLGATMQMWETANGGADEAVSRCPLRPAWPRQVRSPSGPYSMERFGKDVLAILDDLNIEKVHWCGLSMGGMVGQWLGANAPERIEKLIPRQHLLLLSRSNQLAEPHQGGDRGRHCVGRGRHYRRMADGGFPRTRASNRSPPEKPC